MTTFLIWEEWAIGTRGVEDNLLLIRNEKGQKFALLSKNLIDVLKEVGNGCVVLVNAKKKPSINETEGSYYEKYLKAINQKFDGGFVVYDVSLKESFNNVD